MSFYDEIVMIRDENIPSWTAGCFVVYPKSISDRIDTPQSQHPENQEAKGKRTLSTKDRAQECVKDT
jgi:hypothetical protein